jgi:hypothetical protein
MLASLVNHRGLLFYFYFTLATSSHLVDCVLQQLRTLCSIDHWGSQRQTNLTSDRDICTDTWKTPLCGGVVAWISITQSRCPREYMSFPDSNWYARHSCSSYASERRSFLDRNPIRGPWHSTLTIAMCTVIKILGIASGYEEPIQEQESYVGKPGLCAVRCP